jgi:hypothetical protein
MSRRLPLPLELTAGPFRSREADELGIPRKRLEAADLARPHHGMRTAAPPETLLERVRALAVVLREGDAFSHLTAAALLGAQLPWTRDTRLHVTSVGGNDRMRRPGVAGHRADSLPVIMLGELPIVEPAHVWVQLATMLSCDDLVAVGDRWVTPPRRGMQRGPALASIDALRAAIPDRARGAARARRALADVRVGAESRMET